MHLFDYSIYDYEPPKLITIKIIRVKKTDNFLENYFFLDKLIMKYFCVYCYRRQKVLLM